MGGGVIFVGWDMNVAFTMAAALGVPAAAVAEFLPPVEQIAVKAMNDRVGPKS